MANINKTNWNTQNPQTNPVPNCIWSPIAQVTQRIKELIIRCINQYTEASGIAIKDMNADNRTTWTVDTIGEDVTKEST